MARMHDLAGLQDPDELELREHASRRRVAVRINTVERYRRNGLPIELYAKRPGNPMLRAFPDCGSALEWLTAGEGA